MHSSPRPANGAWPERTARQSPPARLDASRVYADCFDRTKLDPTGGEGRLVTRRLRSNVETASREGWAKRSKSEKPAASRSSGAAYGSA